jgi:hypothetical protein
MLFQTETIASFQSNMGRDRRRTRDQKDDPSVLVKTRPHRTVESQQACPKELHFLSGNAQEIQHFLFFRTITALDLAGPFDFGFWTCETLQSAHIYPALWHAAIALGAMHCQFIANNSLSYCWHSKTDGHVRFVLMQFNKSIMNLSKMLSKQALNKQDKVIFLTTCILFTCLCTLQGKQNEAFMHISNGMKLIHEWDSGDSSQCGTHIAMEMLLLLFTQLDSQGLYIRRRLGLKPAHQCAEYPTIVSSPLEPFPTCLQAYVELERLINHLIQLDTSEDYTSPDPDFTITKQKDVYFQVLTAWETKFEGYLVTNSKAIEENTITLLRIRQLFANTLFNHPSKGELGHDEFVNQYTMIVTLAGWILEARNVVASQRPQQIDFSLSVVIAEPLLFTAMHCRKPSVRRQALQLLKMYPRREGIFDGVLATKLVEDYIVFEEKSCPRSGSSLDGDAPLSTDSNICTTGPWICQKHRISFQMFFMRASGVGIQAMQRWRT